MDASLYAEHAALQEDHWWFRGRRSVCAAVLDRHLVPRSNRRILDAGCGAGGMLSMLAEHGSVRGIEPEPSVVAWCHEHYPDWQVEVGSLPDGIPAGAELDLITAFDVIEHIDDDCGAVHAMANALAPDGQLLVTVPALPWLWSPHDDRNEHHRRYTAASLDTVISRAGLTIEHRTYYNTALFPLAVARRMLQRFDRDDADSDLFVPAAPVNKTLATVFGAERHVVSRWQLPIGVSLLALARRS